MHEKYVKLLKHSKLSKLHQKPELDIMDFKTS